MKHELGGQIMNKLSGLRAKTYSYLKSITMKIKKALRLKFQYYKNCLEAA